MIQLEVSNCMPTYLYNAIHQKHYTWDTESGVVTFDSESDCKFAKDILVNSNNIVEKKQIIKTKSDVEKGRRRLW